MKVFFIILFIFSLARLAVCSGISREGGFLPTYKGDDHPKPDNRSIQSPVSLFTFDGIKKEMPKSRSGRFYPHAAGDSITARFCELTGESRISSGVFVNSALLPRSDSAVNSILAASIYPNPAANTIIFEASALSGNDVLSIFNSNGKKVLTQPITDRQTSGDISSLLAGVYFLRYGNGNTVEVASLIKE